MKGCSCRQYIFAMLSATSKTIHVWKDPRYRVAKAKRITLGWNQSNRSRIDLDYLLAK